MAKTNKQKGKKKSSFSGDGRKLGTGAVVKNKARAKPKMEDPEEEFAPQSEDESMDETTENEGEFHDEEEMAEDEYESTDPNGNIIRFQGAVRTKDDEEATVEAVRKDAAFKELGERYHGRIAIIATAAKENSKAKGQPIMEVSDTAKLDKKTTVEFIPCKNGMYFHQSAKFFPMITEQQLRELEEKQKGDDEPCDCVVCKNRAEFAGEQAQLIDPGMLRSGTKRGWSKYGEGRSLGGNNEALK